MMGDALLVSPVLTNESSVINPYFTAGAWYSAWDYNRFDSKGQAVRMDVPLGDIAVHLRGGAIVPMQQSARVTRDVRLTPVTLVVTLPAEPVSQGALKQAGASSSAGPVPPYALEPQCAAAREGNIGKLVSCGLLYADSDAPEVSDNNSLQAWFTAVTSIKGDSGFIESSVLSAAPEIKDKLRIQQVHVIGLPKQGDARRVAAARPRISQEAWNGHQPAVSVSAARSQASRAEFDGERGVLRISGLDLLASEPFSIHFHMA